MPTARTAPTALAGWRCWLADPSLPAHTLSPQPPASPASPAHTQCRFKHTRQQGPPPDPETLEAAKPREHRNLNIVANQVGGGRGVHRMRSAGQQGVPARTQGCHRYRPA